MIEVILALAIFSMLCGAVFFSVQAVGNASAVLGVEQMRARKIDAFLSWCRRGFRGVTARSEILLRSRDTGAAGLAVELVIRKAPGAFSLGEFDAGGSDLILAAIPDGRGSATISIVRFPGSMSLEEAAKQIQKEDWLPLLEGVKLLRWSFWSPQEEKFLEEWQDERSLPRMLRLQMTLDSGEEIETVFRLPKLVARGESAADDSEGSQRDAAELEGQNGDREQPQR